MQHDVSGLVAGDEPSVIVRASELGRPIGKHAAIQHVLVERRLGLLVRQAACFGLFGEVVFELAAQTMA